MSSILTCASVSKRFGGLVALDALDLDVEAGSVVGLIGPNGSGKTTFFNLLTGVSQATSGEITFGGQVANDLSPQQLFRLGIARTFQRSRLNLSLSVFENVVLGSHLQLSHGVLFNLFRRTALEAQARRAFAEASELLGIFNPALLDQMLQPVARLSLINRRRVEICRALIGRPRLLLLDEPSAGMTHEETTQLMDDILQVKSRSSDLAIIIVEHEMAVIEKVTSKCVVLNFGRKIAEGTYSDVVAHREVQRAYLGVA